MLEFATEIDVILAVLELTTVIVDEDSNMAYPVPEGSCIPPAGDQ